jgi:aminoglycoside 3-N-acetyltransferase
MMLASWEGNPYRMEQWAEAHQAACRVECPAFDPRTAPADHRELSILAEYLRTWPGGYRSNHPLASFVAVGARAQWLTIGQRLDYPHGPESPLARLCAADGKVVLLGAALSNLTLLHHAEHLAQVPQKRIEHYQMPVLQGGGRVWVEIEEYDTTDGIADFGCDDYFLAIGEAYLASGKGRTAQVGNARSFLFEADDLKQFARHWMETHYHGPR